ncbi:MAG: ABC transporter ATP-binding protein [Pseudomonadota bacterium]
MSSPLPRPRLQVDQLTVQFAGGTRAVDGVQFTLDDGETVGLVGESGSGKSVTSLAVLGLLPRGGCTVSGSVRYGDQELLGAAESRLRPLRGGEIAMIFQEPMTALNPVFTVGTQLGRVIRRHRGLRGAAAQTVALEVLTDTGIPEPGRRLKQYPHELSGGMRQRVLIAMALACQPRLLIADEPTTALDVTTQAQVLERLSRLQVERGLGLLLITHDLGVVAQLCDRVLVMYAGRIVEQRPVGALFASPWHPYTAALLEATPTLEGPIALNTGVEASSHTALASETGCAYAARCPRAQAKCTQAPPPLTKRHAQEEGEVACFHPLSHGEED